MAFPYSNNKTKNAISFFSQEESKCCDFGTTNSTMKWKPYDLKSGMR